MSSMDYLPSRLHLKALSETGIFTGYASVFQIIDQQGEKVAPGAFRRSLQGWQQKKQLPKMLWQHDLSQPIGRWLSMQEDDHGLRVEGQLLMALPKAQEAYVLLKENILDGLSIGFLPVEAHYDATQKCRVLDQVELYEVSLVTYGANTAAKIITVKNSGGGSFRSQPLETFMTDSLDASTTLADLTQKYETQEARLAALSAAVEEHQLATQRPATERSHNPIALQPDAYSKAFGQYLRKGAIGDLLRLEHKNLSATHDVDGGYAVPPTLSHQLISVLQEASPLRKLCQTVTISTDVLEMLVDKDIAEAGWAAELDPRQETRTPELGKVRIPVHELYARPRATDQVLKDSQAYVNLENWLVQKVSEQMSRLETQAFLLGTGHHQPRGLLSYPMRQHKQWEWGTLEHLITGKNGSVEEGGQLADLLVSLVEALKPAYRSRAVWLMPRSVIATIIKHRLAKGESTGAYLWKPAEQVGQPDLLLGYPVYCLEEMPELQADKASTSILFGDLKQAYQIVDRAGTRILRDPYTQKPYVEFYVTRRVGGDVVNFEAVKALSFMEE